MSVLVVAFLAPPQWCRQGSTNINVVCQHMCGLAAYYGLGFKLQFELEVGCGEGMEDRLSGLMLEVGEPFVGNLAGGIVPRFQEGWSLE